MTPTISVAIPVYNGEPHIAEAVTSVLRQTHADFELILVDNRSTDGTVAAVEAVADERVRIVRCEEHVDAAANWSRAVALTTGRYVKLLCADDALAPDCLERQLAPFEAPGGDGLAIVAGQRDIIDDEGRVILAAWGLRGLRGRVSGAEAIRWCARSGGNPLGETAAVLVRGDLMRDVGGYHPETGYMLDVDMWLRLLRHGDLEAQEGSVAVFRVHDSSWSKAVNWEQARDARRLYKPLRDDPASPVTTGDYIAGAVRSEVLQLGRNVMYAVPKRFLRARSQHLAPIEVAAEREEVSA